MAWSATGFEVRVIVVDGSALTIEDVVAVAAGEVAVQTGENLAASMAPSKALVDAVVADDRIVYGITTGFGALANTHIPPGRAAEMQVDLLRSHAAGVGPLLSTRVVRAMLLCRARTLAQGYSGVRPIVVERLVDFIDRDIVPAVPGQGSVGASGDLAPFAHLALPLIGEGEVLTEGGGTEPAASALERKGLEKDPRPRSSPRPSASRPRRESRQPMAEPGDSEVANNE